MAVGDIQKPTAGVTGPAAIDVKNFAIDSTFELAADYYNIELPGSSMFRNAAPTDGVTVTMGFLDGSGNPQTVGHIKDGPVLEYEITVDPNSIVERVRGRDLTASALDRFFRKRYVREPAKVSVESIALLDTIETVTGQFTARHVAMEAASAAGLTLSWETRDYQLFDDFEANGRVLDVLKTLIAPWSQVEPFKVDVFVEGNVLIVRPRPFPISAANYSLSAEDSRRNTFRVRKRRTRKVRTLTLRGQRTALLSLTVNPLPPDDSGIGGIFSGTTKTVHTFSETFTSEGVLLNRIDTDSTYRMPDFLLVKKVQTTINSPSATAVNNALPSLVRETVEYDYEPSKYDVNGPVNSPKLKGSSTTVERVDPSDEDKLFRTWEETKEGLSYDALGFLKEKSTLTRKLDLEANFLMDSEFVVMTYQDLAPLIVEQITSQFLFNEDEKMWVLRNRQSQVQAGHKPGGPGRSLTQTSEGQSLGQGGSEQVTVVRTMSTDSDAVDVEYSNANLTEDDLNFIADQFESAQNLWEHELVLEGVGMPWVRKGLTLALSGLLAEDGSEISLPPMLITEVQSRYDESRFEAAMTMSIRAFGWSG